MSLKYNTARMCRLCAAGMAANGLRLSSKADDESNAFSSDPSVGSLIGKEPGPEFRAYLKEHFRTYVRAKRCGRAFAPVLYNFIMAVASEVRNRDVVAIFGRDCLYLTAVLDVIQHKLRGRWYYFEGASRSMSLLKPVQDWVFRTLISGGVPERVFGLDTGWTGSIPKRLLAEPFPKHIVRLMSSDYNRKLSKTGSYSREMMISFEHLPKPFMRPHSSRDVAPTGEIRMRFARPEDSLMSLAFWRGVRAWTKQRLPHVGNDMKEMLQCQVDEYAYKESCLCVSHLDFVPTTAVPRSIAPLRKAGETAEEYKRRKDMRVYSDWEW